MQHGIIIYETEALHLSQIRIAKGGGEGENQFRGIGIQIYENYP